VSFFEPPSPPKEPAPRRRPPWHGAPENELGVTVPLRFVLVRNDELVLAVVDAVAYSAGFSFRVALRVRPEAEFDPHTFFPMRARPTEGGLRLGIAFADGRKTANGFPPTRGETGPPEIVLAPGGGGGGGGRSFELRYWVYPLPPPGPVTFAVEWLGRGIGELTHEVDSAPIRDAAAQSEELWEDGREYEGGGWAQYAP
jgi:hypothetical protein